MQLLLFPDPACMSQDVSIQEPRQDPCAQDTRCPRCQGFMVDILGLRDYISDASAVFDAEDGWGAAKKCVNCGEVLDPVIIRNRAKSLLRLTRASLARA
ncbi:MAG: hypothetical protein AB1411_15990 [Nitrospirota bacterium]